MLQQEQSLDHAMEHGATAEGTRRSYLWKIVMEGGQVVEFEGGNTAGAAQFVEDVQTYHLTGQRPTVAKNFRFPTHNHGTELAADILVDISKVQMVVRCPLGGTVTASSARVFRID